MFTDIVGYTAMMQSDEPTGRKKVKRYREVLGKYVEEYHGETLQHYGDGSLTIFSSTVEAIRCARKIQSELLQPLAVDLKIGVHVGDVFIEDGNIYGDGVNLASRVESMAVQGSILMTDRVMHDIKSHPEFELVSMGKFLFKNVEHPIELFAVKDENLILPNPWDLKGKGTRLEDAKKPGNLKPLVRGLGLGFIGVLLGAAIWLGVAYTGSGNKPETREIEFVDDQGNLQKRQIPTMENTNKLVIFPFESELTDSVSDWMRIGIPFLLDKDLEQNHSIYSIQPFSLKDEYAEYSYPYPEEIPFAVQINIAQDLYCKFFLTGKLNEDNGKKSLDVKVFEAGKGDLVYEKKVVASSANQLVDAITKALGENLFVDFAENQKMDLPVGDLLSKKEEALRNYILAQEITVKDIRKVDEALVLAEAAVEVDPSFAECYSLLAQYYIDKNDETKSRASIEKAMGFARSLPERQRFPIQAAYYGIHNQRDKNIQLLEKWNDLYPQDYTPLSALMNFYLSSNQFGKAKVLGESGIQNGHKGNHLLKVASVYSAIGEFDKAEKLYTNYGKLYPEKVNDLLLLGDLYIKKGELQKAKDYYEGLEVLNPNSYRILLSQAKVEDRLGNLSAVNQLQLAALARAKTPGDTFSVYNNMRIPLERLGKFKASFAIAAKSEEVLNKYQPPYIAKQMLLFNNNEGAKLVQNGRGEEFLQRLDEVKQMLPQSAERLDCVGYYLYYMYAEDKEKFPEQSDKCLSIISQSYDNFELVDQAVRDRLKGDYTAALASYEAYFERVGFSASYSDPELCEIYRLAGNPQKGLDFAEKLLSVYPSHPLYKRHKAQNLHALGKTEEAKSLMQEVMETWKDADEEYQEYQEAKKFAAELGV